MKNGMKKVEWSMRTKRVVENSVASLIRFKKKLK